MSKNSENFHTTNSYGEKPKRRECNNFSISAFIYNGKQSFYGLKRLYNLTYQNSFGFHKIVMTLSCNRNYVEKMLPLSTGFIFHTAKLPNSKLKHVEYCFNSNSKE